MSDLRKYKIKELPFGSLLKETPEPPNYLFVRGTLPKNNPHYLCVVGSRKASNYAKDACAQLISGLSGYNIVIVSGLAFGIDAEAHRAAISANLKTIAVPGSGLNDSVIYPATNLILAKKILDTGGALISEYEPDFRATVWSFPKRNRIMAGISHAILIVEAKEKSGTLITARLGLDYNREILAVPGPIFQSGSIGVNHLIRNGATPITESKDILETLGIDTIKEIDEYKHNLTTDEKHILSALSEPLHIDELINITKLPSIKIIPLISMLEIKGIIKKSNGKIYNLRNENST